MLGVGVDVGYGRCEPRREGNVQCTKRKLKTMWGGGGGTIFEPKTLSMYFKFLSLILFEIWHLQNFISIFSKGRNFTRGD